MLPLARSLPWVPRWRSSLGEGPNLAVTRLHGTPQAGPFAGGSAHVHPPIQLATEQRAPLAAATSPIEALRGLDETKANPIIRLRQAA